MLTSGTTKKVLANYEFHNCIDRILGYSSRRDDRRRSENDEHKFDEHSEHHERVPKERRDKTDERPKNSRRGGVRTSKNKRHAANDKNCALL